MQYYKPVHLANNVVMSCDMLRLSFNMNDYRLKDFNKYINELALNNSHYDVKTYYNLGMFKYRNLVVVSNIYTGCSFSMGFHFNDLTKTTTACFIEFNPNKTLSNDYVYPFLAYIKQHSNFLDIVRLDIAIDIPVAKQNVSLEKDARKYSKMYKLDLKNRDMSNCTEYLGQRNSNGFVKLYNKQIESNLSYPLTRLELTLDKLSYDEFKKHLPSIAIQSEYTLHNLTQLNDTERVLYYLLNENLNKEQYFKMLGRKMQDKLKKILFEENSILDISESEFYKLMISIRQIIA